MQVRVDSLTRNLVLTPTLYKQTQIPILMPAAAMAMRKRVVYRLCTHYLSQDLEVVMCIVLYRWMAESVQSKSHTWGVRVKCVTLSQRHATRRHVEAKRRVRESGYPMQSRLPKHLAR